MTDRECIGTVDGKLLYVPTDSIAQEGLENVKERFGLVSRFPVVTDLSGNIVLVKGNSHEDAIHRYLNRVEPPKEQA